LVLGILLGAGLGVDGATAWFCPEARAQIAGIIVGSTISAGPVAQTAPPPSVWTPLKVLEGSWQGTGKGKPGTATVERTYELVMNGKFLSARNKSVWAPTAANPKGEIHEDWGMFSFDRARKQFVYRQFHVEGFVNQYAAEPVEGNAKRVVFVSEAIENIPPGWRARETYAFLSNDEFTETFELAEPGKEFEIYSETRLKRKK
jgi:hypothetical protein